MYLGVDPLVSNLLVSWGFICHGIPWFAVDTGVRFRLTSSPRKLEVKLSLLNWSAAWKLYLGLSLTASYPPNACISAQFFCASVTPAPGCWTNLPSTLLMNAIPAKIAGVKKIILANPRLNNKLNPAIIYAAKKLGIKEIYSMGGAQAIGSLTYIQKVDKIVGPGNIYVAKAKKEVFGDVGVEGMVAGPSEITVVADKKTEIKSVITSLIGQAEHDVNSQCIIISKDLSVLKEIKNFGVSRIIYTDINKDGTKKGPNIKDTMELSTKVKIPFIISGGISSIEDVKKIKSLNNSNIEGVIVGKSIYDGDIKINELAKEI